jgi:DNA repair protein RecO (recombination protein O)
VREDLVYVSPKSGRAVSREAAGVWADRLLPLPAVLRGEGEAPDAEIRQALDTTGYFLREHMARQLGDKPLPQARDRLLDLLARS